MIQTLQDLFTFILRHESTLVFGNLGRKSHVVYKFLTEQLGGVDVVVVSPYYLFPTSGDHRIRTLEQATVPATLHCDLLIYVEPMPHSRVFNKPEGVGRMVVLTSHLLYRDDHGCTQPTLVAYFEGTSVLDTIEKTRSLLTLQDGSVQTNNVNHIRPSVNHMHVQVIDGKDPTLSLEPDTYAIVDLTRHTSPFHMYLAFWDAFDVMIRNIPSITRWVVGFPERHGAKAFDQLAQDVIDRLYCLRFEHGNVLSNDQSNLRLLLSILPFYKSGVVDPQTFNVTTDTFCGIEYTAPATAEEVFKAGAKYNLEHWVGSVYRIQ